MKKRREDRMKEHLGVKNCLYPMPVVIVGSLVNGRPNYLTIAHVGIMDFTHVSISSAKSHYSNKGIEENGTFSVNIPGTDLVERTDYVGIVSGGEVDKSGVFTPFYGELKTAPMIEECPINMECRLERTVEFPKHLVFIGEIVATYCNEELLEGDSINFVRLDPILYIHENRGYWSIGHRFAEAWNVGKNFRKRQI